MESNNSLVVQTLTPSPSIMIENLRSIGYRLETAIADIVDNSITAQAKSIDVQFNWSSDEDASSIYLVDDGIGMTHQAIGEAMRLGTQNQAHPRHQNDLGRFGLGLKTASFSQCRRLTVISKKAGEPIGYWTWDLDHVQQTQEWQILSERPESVYLALLEDRPSGTIVLWDKIDRKRNMLSEHLQNRFEAAAHKTAKHLEMIFHRYLEQKKITLTVNGLLLEPWNPYFGGIAISEQPLRGTDQKVSMQGFTLQHRSHLTVDEYEKGGGIGGWNAQQGFYVYRNERLLLAGHWLGLPHFKKEDKFQLARIRLDLTSEFDQEWQIDIRKSTAIPPTRLKEQLKLYAAGIRTKSAKVYAAHGGKSIDGDKPGLSPEEQQGLFGELHFLRALLLEAMSSSTQMEHALTSWVGSSGHRHDFNYQHWAVEIKTTVKKDFKILISNEHQLDDSGLDFLGLCYYVIQPNAANGQALPQLIAEIETLLGSKPLIKIFQHHLAQCNYAAQETQLYAKQLFGIKETHYYRVWEGFPRLIPNNMPQGTVDAKYYVQLPDCKTYELEEDLFFNSLIF
jgi:Putative  PD-(D/E)XK family member, (DUF4420)/Histidine kinase-, DNA gyrase B-, and HSP90-like ATPase